MKNVLIMESGSFKTFGGAAYEAYDIYKYLKKTSGFRVWLYGDFSKIDRNAVTISDEQMLSGVYDVVMLNSIRDVPIIENYILKDVVGRPRFFYVDRGNVLLNFNKAGPKRLLPKMIARRYLMDRMKKWLDCYVALSAEQYEFAKGFFGSRTKIVYLPIAPKQVFRKTSKKTPSGAAIYVGRLDERQKKVGKLIKGISRVVAQNPKLRRNHLLTLVGAGPLELRYKAWVETAGLRKNITFGGRVGENELLKLYNRASFFVSYSEWEGMSATFLEAMACGLPMLINDRNNTMIKKRPERWLVQDNYNGLVFDYADMDSFAGCFYSLYTNSRLRGHLSRNAYRFSKKFSKRENLESYGKIVDHLVRNVAVPNLVFM